MEKKLTFIDLFAGAGGLSEGFMKAGYTPVAHIETNNSACYTLKTRLAFHYLKLKKLDNVYKSYLKEEITRDEFYSIIPESLLKSVIEKKIDEKNIEELFKSIDELKVEQKIQEIDVLVGGPPCQAYSTIGRKVNESKKDRDERIHYYKLYTSFLEKYKPKVFVFENVTGLMSFNEGTLFPEIKNFLSGAGYTVEHKELNAADFGVLQNRKRIIVIGWKNELNFNYPEFKKVKQKYIVNDLLKDLPSLKEGEGKRTTTYKRESTEYLNKFEIRNGYDFTTLHIARPHNNNDLKIYEAAIKLWNEKQQRLKYPDLPKELITHKNIESFLDRFKVVAKDLKQSHTVIAHIAKDGHYYIHPSLRNIRSISVREAARLQSFSDDYFFEGSRTSVFTQIGNAVPPLMAKIIAENIMRKLNEL